jgi:hypothetical protein
LVLVVMLEMDHLKQLMVLTLYLALSHQQVAVAAVALLVG